MALTEEKIRAAFSKEVKTKTLLISPDKLKEVENQHAIEGWNLIKKEEINNRLKLTFQKVK